MRSRIVLSLLAAFMLALVLLPRTLAQNQKKILYAILIDNTGSLRSQFSEVAMISKRIVEHAHKRGVVSLFSFRPNGDRKNPTAVVTPGTEWSQDKNLLEGYIDTLFIIPGQTTLVDAIDGASGQLSSAALKEGTDVEKILFLITDGEDRRSKINEKQLLKTLQERSVKVFAVGLLKELEQEHGFIPRSQKEKAKGFLTRLAKESGGRVVFQESDKEDLKTSLNELLVP